jgi:hypothetical protein
MYEVAGWTALGLGLVLGAFSLSGRVRKRAGPAATRPDPLGRLVRSGVLLIAVGLALLGSRAGDSAIVWAARLILGVGLLYVLFSWLRARTPGRN